MDRLEILARAWTAGASVEGLDETGAVRAIQRAEGFAPCFGCGLAGSCGQPGCAFRADCEQIKVLDEFCGVAPGDAPERRG